MHQREKIPQQTEQHTLKRRKDEHGNIIAGEQSLAELSGGIAEQQEKQGIETVQPTTAASAGPPSSAAAVTSAGSRSTAEPKMRMPPNVPVCSAKIITENSTYAISFGMEICSLCMAYSAVSVYSVMMETEETLSTLTNGLMTA